MTGPEHYREAERLSEAADGVMDADYGYMAHASTEERIARRTADLAAAQVHATLALAAATAEANADRHAAIGDPPSPQWQAAFEPEPEPEPEDYDPGPECDDQGGMSEYWDLPEDRL